MKLTLHLLLTGVAFLLLPLTMQAQRSITGLVTDAETGEALIGANVSIPGTSTGTITDFDGKYSLEVPDNASLLEYSYTGYGSQQIELSTQVSNIIDVQLSAGELLEEVVVIGYGTVKREDATGAIASVNSEDFNAGSITSPQELVVGKIAGVQITTNTAPGEGATIRIRGGSSLSASNDPLIVIDGVPLDNGGISGSRNNLNVVNPNDIETITVLKDASATAIYGSRASNGVILITTKKGSLSDGIKINYTGNASVNSIVEQVDVLHANEYRNLINEQFPEGHPATQILGDADTDWQNEIYQSAFGQDHSLNVSGGIAKVLPYRLSLGYTNKQGILKTDKFQRTTVGLNLTPGFLDNQLQIRVNLKGMFSNNDFANRGAIWSAAAFDPTQPILDASSPYGGYYTWLDGPTGNPNSLATPNPIALLNLVDDESNVTRYIANASVDYRMPFLPALRANLNLGYDYAQGEGFSFVPTEAAFAFNALTGGGSDRTYEQKKTNELLEFYLNYAQEFGSSKLDLMGGYSWQRNYFESSSKVSDVAGTASETQQFEDSGELFLLSLFGRLNYSIQERYYFTFSLRRDASSRFSPDTRWGLFPAGAFAMKILDKEDATLNKLKLRLGYGVTGQQEIGSYYQYLPTYTIGQVNAAYPFGNEYITTLRPEEYDANIKWEETTTYNVGLDFGFLNDRIFGSIEYYIRETQDLLNRIPVPAGTNLSNFIDTNVGDLENKGVELTLGFIPVQKEDLFWELGFNVTRNENKITKLTATDDPDYLGVQVGGIAGAIGNTIQVHSVGFPANSFFVYEQVYDANGFPVEGLYVDRNGDGVLNPDDLYRTEQPVPDWFFGINSNLQYKNFNFSFSGRANVGNYIYNNIQSNNAFFGSLYNSTNFLSNVHRDISSIAFQNPQYLSDHFLQDASFFRLDFVSLSYSFSDLFEKISALSVSATIQNPLLITNYTGLDPEVFNGIDGNIYPRSRAVVFGLNVNF